MWRNILRNLEGIVILSVAISLPSASYAGKDDPDTSMFSFSGFGTLGVVHSSEDQADFTGSLFKPNGAGHTDSWSSAVDSLIGVQATANITPQLSAVLQVIAEQNYDNTISPHVEWANIKYQFTPDFSIRAGRIVLPTFLLSDVRKVGYTYPWVRPPREVYRLQPLTNSDGLDISYRLHFGELISTLQLDIGKSSPELVNNAGKGELRKLRGITNTTEYGALTTHISYQTFHGTLASLNSFFDNFRLFGPQGVAIADKYDLNDKRFYYFAAGASYDPGDWFAMGEWAHSNTHCVFGTGTAWYAGGGYRFGKFTPYLTYAHAAADNLSDPGLPIPAAAPLNAALNGILSTKAVQHTISVGGRWDFTTNAALKLQLDHTSIGAGSSSTFINTQPGYQPGGMVNVFSATMDFVF